MIAAAPADSDRTLSDRPRRALSPVKPISALARTGVGAGEAASALSTQSPPSTTWHRRNQNRHRQEANSRAAAGSAESDQRRAARKLSCSASSTVKFSTTTPDARSG